MTSSCDELGGCNDKIRALETQLQNAEAQRTFAASELSRVKGELLHERNRSLELSSFLARIRQAIYLSNDLPAALRILEEWSKAKESPCSSARSPS